MRRKRVRFTESFQNSADVSVIHLDDSDDEPETLSVINSIDRHSELDSKNGSASTSETKDNSVICDSDTSINESTASVQIIAILKAGNAEVTSESESSKSNSNGKIKKREASKVNVEMDSDPDDCIILEDNNLLPLVVDRLPSQSSSLPNFIPLEYHKSKNQQKFNRPLKGKKELKRLNKGTDPLPVKLIGKKGAGNKNSKNGRKDAKKKIISQNFSQKQQNSNDLTVKKPIPVINLQFSNIINNDSICQVSGLRPVVIDGANVGFCFRNGNFLMKPVIQVIDYFKNRGHTEIICFLPHTLQFRCETPAERNSILKYESEGIMSYTPARKTAKGKRIIPYDDRFIIQYATEKEGVIISNDQYRDLINEDVKWRETIENRVINYTVAGKMIMFPKDPLGPLGPNLDEMLRFPED